MNDDQFQYFELTSKVIDISGIEILILLDGPIAAGEHTIKWNGINSSQKVDSGVNFYQ